MKIGIEAYNDMEKKAAMDKMTDKRKDEMPYCFIASVEMALAHVKASITGIESNLSNLERTIDDAKTRQKAENKIETKLDIYETLEIVCEEVLKEHVYRKDISPPVPDDVAEAIKKGKEALAWYMSDNYPETSNCYISSGTLRTLLRAAITPDAGLVPDKYHRHHEIHEGNCITCYTMQGEINHLHRRLDSRDQVDAAECAGLRGEIDKLREVLERLVKLNNEWSPFGGEIYKDRIDAAWEKANNALRETENK